MNLPRLECIDTMNEMNGMWVCHTRPVSVSVAFSALLTEAFLLVEKLRLEVFTLLLVRYLLFVIGL